MSGNPTFVAERHGVILAYGETKAAAAAAAAAAARASRCKVRLATPDELAPWRRTVVRRRAGKFKSERELLEAIRVDCRRALWACDCYEGCLASGDCCPRLGCSKPSDCHETKAPRFHEYDTPFPDTDAVVAFVRTLEVRIEVIDADLRELAMRERQIDAFPLTEARA